MGCDPRRRVCGVVFALLLAAAVSLAACKSEGAGGAEEMAEEAAAAEATITPEARKKAQEIFTNRCVTCHGEMGAGDGPGSKALDPKPRDLRQAEWQESVTDEHIEEIIVGGGAAVGLAPAMPANPDLSDKPAVVAALREHVRGLGKGGE
ncbi:MAG: c-type cytochrome [Myxococcota bacterium]